MVVENGWKLDNKNTINSSFPLAQVVAHHFLADLPERREPVDEGGGDGEGAEQEVGDRQVDDEDVPRGAHGLGAGPL